MRDPARIPELCRLLERAWARCPDARLGQLLVQALGPAQPCPQVFYAEDGRVRRGLERLASEGLAAPELPPQRDVEPRWEVLGEPIQSAMRALGAQGVPGMEEPYERLKELTRGRRIGQVELVEFVRGLGLPSEVEERLAAMTPATYVGLAPRLVDHQAPPAAFSSLVEPRRASDQR